MPLIVCSTRAAAAEPEHALPQLFADPLGLQGRFAEQVLLQQLQRAFDQRPRRVAAADADEPVVADDFDQRVVLHVRIGPARPAVIVRGPAEGNRADGGDFHESSSDVDCDALMHDQDNACRVESNMTNDQVTSDQ